jgi:hypothetical protein
MSTATYLAWSLVMGGAFALLLYVISHYFGTGTAFARATHDARTKRLQRRLEKRLARGTDRYFEERRAIETAIVDNARPENAAVRNRWVDGALSAAGVVLVGAVAMNLLGSSLFHEMPPAWSDHLALGWTAIYGLQILITPSTLHGGSAIGARLFGLLLVMLGIAAVFLPIYHSTQRT